MKKFKLEKQNFNVDLINEGTKNEMEIEGFIFSPLKTALAFLVVLITFGLFLCILLWKKSIMLRCTHRKCPLKDAHKVWLKASYDQEFVEDIHRSYVSNGKITGSIHFYNKNFKYIWQEELETFTHLNGLADYSVNDITDMGKGLSTNEADKALITYGSNKMEIVVPSVWRLIIDEALNPFYIFQLYVIVVWGIEMFYQYCIILAVCSIIAISYSVYEMRKSSITLRDTIHSESIVTVIRDSKEVEISSHDLVPGDILVISSDYIFECDAILISGSCIVNESSLTGESVPVVKIPLTKEDGLKYQLSAHKKNTLFNGTKVVSASKQKNLAVVCKTSFYTLKGELVLSIMFPKPVDFHFYSSFKKYMIFLIFIGLISMTYSAIMWKQHGATDFQITIKVLDILTFVVPPLLSAGLTFAAGFAHRRLKKKGIHCVSIRYISMTGGLDLFCFDKTGTLTNDTLHLYSVVSTQDSRFTPEEKDVSVATIGKEFIYTMASCHSLCMINNEMLGDSVDIELFNATGWGIDSSKESDNENYIFKAFSEDKLDSIRVLKIFPFESKFQRMSVITKDSNDSYKFCLKGSPEVVQKLCSTNSVPEDLNSVLQEYTSQGYRVLALAFKDLSNNNTDLDVNTLKRDQLEKNLTFLGLVILENLLKSDTAENIRAIENAGLRTVMSTGDNIETAVNVAQKCGMIKDDTVILKVQAETLSPDNQLQHNIKIDFVPMVNVNAIKPAENNVTEEKAILIEEKSPVLAMEGNTFNLLRVCSSDLFDKILSKCVVFARMSPDQKVKLVEEFQAQGYHVGMCGDGANDCGALKAAHSGIALSVEEASMASPFTFKDKSISCVPELLKEGRATLSCIFTVFNYQVSAFCFVALLAVLMLFYNASLFVDIQWVLCDVLFIAPPLLFGLTAPADTLHHTKPLRNLISFVPTFSLISFNVFVFAEYLFIWYYVPTLPEYVEGNYNSSMNFRESDLRSSMLFIAMCFAYIFCIYMFSYGKPHRQPFYTNIFLVVVFVLENVYVFLIIFIPGFNKYAGLVHPKDAHLNFIVIGICYGGFICACLWQYFFIEKVLEAKIMPLYYEWRGPQHKFAKLEEELSQRPSWPQSNTSEVLDIDLSMVKTISTSKIIGDL